MLIQGQAVPGQEGNIIVDRHINGIFQCVDFQQSGILIIGSIHCIIQRKQLFFVAEQHSEDTVLECASDRQLFVMNCVCHPKPPFSCRRFHIQRRLKSLCCFFEIKALRFLFRSRRYLQEISYAFRNAFRYGIAA